MTIDPISIGITIGLYALQTIIASSRKIRGPRLDDLKITTSEFGVPITHYWGTVRYEGPVVVEAEDLKEVEKKKKGKGGTQITYRYFGTWREVIAIEAGVVLQIRMNRKLVFDRTGAGPLATYRTPEGDVVTLDAGPFVTFYDGNEAQLPDPRLAAWYEAKFGVGSAPAYRGVMSAVYKDVPLDAFGNQLPQSSYVLARDPEDAFIYETFDSQYGSSRLWGHALFPDGQRAIFANTSGFEIWHLPSRTLMSSGPIESHDPVDGIALLDDGSFWSVDDFDEEIAFYQAPAYVKVAEQPIGFYPLYCQTLRVNGQQLVATVPSATGTNYDIRSPVTMDEVTLAGNAPFIITQYVVDGAGNIWVVGGDLSDSFVQMLCISGARTGESTAFETGLVHAGRPNINVLYSAANDHFVFAHYGIGTGTEKLAIVDGPTLALVTTVDFNEDIFNVPKQFLNWTESASIWLNTQEFAVANLTLLRTITLSDWKPEDADGMLYAPVLHGILCFPEFDDVMTIRYLDRYGQTPAVVGDVIAELAGFGNIDPALINVSDLDQPLGGLWWSGGRLREPAEQLLDIFDSYGAQHDGVLRFRKRGSASVRTLVDSSTVSDLGAHEYGAEAPTKPALAIVQDIELPRRMTITFSDPARDWQRGSRDWARTPEAMSSELDETLNFDSMTMPSDEAQGRITVRMAVRWTSREGLDVQLTRAHADIEPGDVLTVPVDGAPRAYFARAAEYAGDGVVRLALLREWPAAHELPTWTFGAPQGFEPDTLFIPGPSKGFVIDAPMFDDAHDSTAPFFYTAAGGYGPGWPGASIYESLDTDLDTFDETIAAVVSTRQACWGWVTSPMAIALPWIADMAGAIVLQARGVADFATVTESEWHEDAQLLAIIGEDGVEYISARTAVLNGDGTWTLTGLLRGRRGTEHAIAAHAVGTYAVLVRGGAEPGRAPYGVGEIGVPHYHRAPSAGLGPEAAIETTTVLPEAAALKPLAPVQLEAAFSGADIVFDWTRRTRIGGGLLDNRDVPLGEASELYELEILNGGGEVVRVLAASTSTATYTSGQQTTDFGAPLGAIPDWRVFQMSSAVGRGYVGVPA